MQVIDRRKALSIPPLWRLAFRPFFLAGSLFAMLAIPLWVATWTGIWPGFQPTGGWLSWHRHEMLFGFAMAIVAGFLLTAGQTWTGQPGVSGKKLMALAAVWLLARLGWLFGLPLALVIPLDLLFMLGVTGLMARMLWVVKQKRNYPIVAVLTLMIGADVLVLCGIAQGGDGLQRQGVLAGLWLVAALMAIIGGRVIPFFTQRGLGHTEAVKPWVWLDVALLVGTGLIAVLYAAGIALQQNLLIGVLFLAIAAGHLLRLVRWYDGGIWRVPLLWSLHVAMLWLVVAAAGLALWNFGLLNSSSPSLHALSVGSMSGLILAMIARVTLGHTGRPLQLPGGIAAAFVLFNLGAASRVFLSGQWPVMGLWLAAICWALAFALYAWRYAPMLLTARVDGHPG
ncbi:NnrS family protein [Pseudomonas sp. MTM4]|uniref:NnrS family protein n=1 Tax=unclassified Pseudomonas TaxID=196821 RepID=UPI0018D2556C|nr:MULTISPECIES: NnrS family protein [unclassified Pseudomonas]MBC8651297.1 NnrS family protein [Pseudomonas sp. MT4]QXY91828.1 NnrS family protein [Pseudomonas sp. MTM4]